MNLHYFRPNRFKDFCGGSDSKESACHVRDLGSIPESGRSPGEGSGNPLQYPCRENSMDRGAWRATVHGVTKSRTQLGDFIFTLIHSSVGKESACNAGDLGLIPGSGRSPGEGNGNPPQCSCLENPMDRGAWQATICVVVRVRHDLVTKERERCVC